MFFDMALRSLWRQKVRSGLTIFGIILAIGTIVALGSISEGISSLVEEQLQMAGDFIAVGERGGSSAQSGPPGLSSRIEREDANEIAQIDGVERAVPQIRTIDTKSGLFVFGFDIEDAEFFNLDNIEFEEGGWAEPGEKELAIGFQISELQGLKVGDEILIREDDYTVVGVLEEMNSFMDYGTLTSVSAAAETFELEDYYSYLVIDPVDVNDVDNIANEIEDTFDTLEAITSDEAIQSARDSINQIRVFTLGIGVIASIVASIGIINTMVMIVLERKREFGIMKALGAERSTILSFVLLEAAMLGIIGSVIGVSIGFLGTEVLNSFSGFPIAAVTTELAVFSLIYGVLLAVLAALYPASQAIKVDPVEAMRTQ
jgi:putative ABC transport system permease protein